MRRPHTAYWLAPALGGVILLGCSRNHVKQPPPPDPLLVTKKPVEGKTAIAPGPVIAYQEPVYPEPPAASLASAPHNPAPVFQSSVVRHRVPPPAAAPVPTPVATVEQSPPRLQAVPEPTRTAERTGRQPAADGTTAVPAVRTAPAGGEPEPEGVLAAAKAPPTPVAGATYGHAADYTWLQGVLDRHYQGHVHLRYCDAATEDEWGGKVRLSDDPRLTGFREGDVLLVEGELAADHAKQGRGFWKQYPVYKVRNVRLVRSRP